jgi:hypothetical protein
MPLYVTVTRGITVSDDTLIDAATLNRLAQPMVEVTGTLDGTGAVTISDGGVTTAKIADDGVTNDKLDEMPASTLKGNDGGSAANPQDLTVAEARTLLAVTADGSTLEHSGGSIRIKDAGVVAAKIGAGAVTSPKLNYAPPAAITTATATLTVANNVTFNCTPSASAAYTLAFASGDEGKPVLVKVTPAANDLDVSFLVSGTATAIKWKGDAAPDLTTDSGQTDLFLFTMFGTVVFAAPIQSFPA